MDEPRSPLGPNLKHYRERSGYTQVSASIQLDVTLRTIQRWEGGDITPRWPRLLQLARLYDTTVAAFYSPIPNGHDTPVAA